MYNQLLSSQIILVSTNRKLLEIRNCLDIVDGLKVKLESEFY